MPPINENHRIRTSVVLAAHNAEASIGLCLKSVISNKPDEIIVVNDCSTDKSLNIIKRFPVRIINLEKRSGVAKAEKKGIEKAGGDIIFLTNADIVVPPDWIEKHLELHKKADCIGGWVRYDVKANIRKTLALPAYNCSFKKKVIEKIGNLDGNLRSGSEDVEFFLRAKSKGFEVVSDSSMPVLHYHDIGGYGNEIKKTWAYGYRLGKLIKKYPHGRLMSRMFLFLPLYWLFLFLRDFKKFLKEYFLKIVESAGKFTGYIF